MRLLTVVMTTALALFATSSHAWDGVITGTVYGFDVTDGNNFGFRVYLNGVTNVCSGSYNIAYVNEADSNYKTYVAALMLAKATGSTVTLYTNRDASGFCKIGYVTVVG